MSFEIDDTPYDSVLDALNKCNEAVIKALDAMQGAINAKADSQTNVTTSQEILEDIENKKTSIENDKLEVEATLAEVQNLASALAIISTNISNNTTVVSTVKEEILLKLSNINDLIYTISGMASSAVSAANLALQSRNEAEEFKNTVVTDASQVANDKNTVSSDKNTAVSAMNTAVSAATESTNSKNTASNLLQSISDLHDTLLQIKTDVQNILANVNQDKIDIQSLKVAVDADVISSGANAASALSSKNDAGVSETNANFSKVAAQASADLALYYALQLIAQGIPKGSWNATTNTPTLANGTGTVGWWYMCAVGGTVLGYTWNPGDAVFYNGTTWVQIPAFKSFASLLEALTGTENAKFITPQSLLLFFLMNALPYQGANDDLNMGAFNIAANQLSVKGYLSVVQSLTYSTTINFDFTSGSDGIVTLTGNVTFAMSNVPDKSSGTITTIQGSGGSKLLTSITHTGLTVVYRGGVATLTTTAGKSDKIRYERNGTILYVTLDLNY